MKSGHTQSIDLLAPRYVTLALTGPKLVGAYRPAHAIPDGRLEPPFVDQNRLGRGTASRSAHRTAHTRPDRGAGDITKPGRPVARLVPRPMTGRAFLGLASGSELIRDWSRCRLERPQIRR